MSGAQKDKSSFADVGFTAPLAVVSQPLAVFTAATQPLVAAKKVAVFFKDALAPSYGEPKKRDSKEGAEVPTTVPWTLNGSDNFSVCVSLEDETKSWESGWEHIKVSDAQAWHTSRGRPSVLRGVQSDPALDAAALRRSSATAGSSGSSMPTPRSAPDLFRRADKLTNEAFSEEAVAAQRLTALQDRFHLDVPSLSTTGALGRSSSARVRAGIGAGGCSSNESPSSPGGFRYRSFPRSHSVHSTMGFGSGHGGGSTLAARRMSRQVAHGMTQAEFAVRREGKLLVAMVGLPARGKTYIAQRIMRHMEWNELSTRLYNAGNYRRRVVGANTPASFFEPANPEGARLRQKCAELALQDALDALHSETEGVFVAMFDATNTTRKRRAWVREMVEKHPGRVQLVFLETILTDDDQVWKNVREAKLKSPDYAGMAPEAAMKDFLERIAKYKSAYEPVSREEAVPFIRLTNAGEELLSFRAVGHLASRVMNVMNVMRLRLQPILLTRCGESDNEAQGRMGGDGLLTPVGQMYASRLPEAVAHFSREGPIVWTSNKIRARQTTALLNGRWPVLGLAALDDIDTGLVTGMSYGEYAKAFPESFVDRHKDKLHTRFPGGESYMDVFRRLEPLLLELLSELRPVVVVGHLGVLRVIYAYLTGVPPSETASLAIPMHCVLQLNPRGYGYEEWRHFPLRNGPR